MNLFLLFASTVLFFYFTIYYESFLFIIPLSLFTFISTVIFFSYVPIYIILYTHTHSILAKPLHEVTPGEHPFYPLKDFKLRHQEPLVFPEALMVSSNYFNPQWTGLRRVKNVVMVMEYAPSVLPTHLHMKAIQDDVVKLTADQEAALIKAHQLMGFHAAGN